MFTGLIHHTALITEITTSNSGGLHLEIETQFKDLIDGESIAIDGACLTVTNNKPHKFNVDISPETLNVTIAKNYKVKQVINLERALQLSDRLGGHFVNGHIDQTAIISAIKQHGDFYEYIIDDIKTENIPYLIPKGSITINGVSLTINKISQNSCHILLIPHTLKNTNLSQLKTNSIINVEFDLLAKIVAQQTMRINLCNLTL